jgi:protein-arginine kinase activator protein McsA
MRDLEAAVAAEQYERAARLRDAIKELRPQPAGGEPA